MPANRILIITNRVPYPLNDGGNIAMHAMIEGYRKSGWEVALLCMNTTRHYVTQEQQEKIYRGIHSFDTVDIDNRVKPVKTISNFIFSKVPNHVVRFASSAFLQKLREKIGQFQPQVIQVESIYLTGYITEIKKWYDVTFVLRLHNIEYQIWERLAATYPQGVKRYYFKNLSQRIKKYEAWAWQQYSLLLPITETDASVLVQQVPASRILMMPFGISIAKQDYDLSGDVNHGYHIGAMDWLPNMEAINWFLEDIWPAIQKKVPGFKFYFAGRHMPPEYLRLQVKGVTCEGEVADADSFIADKKILIVPLRSGGGVRVKILEAMAAGKVVVSTAIGMQGINAVAGKHYLEANDVEGFADAIAWCRKYSEEALVLGINAAHLIRSQYNMELIMNTLNDTLARMQKSV